MIREIIHDPIILKIKSKDATADDVQIAKDLAETLEHHKDGCVGMAANMIGFPKNIIAILLPGSVEPLVMLNPRIIAKSGAYETQEGCLSLPGERAAERFHTITVRWLDLSMQQQKRTFEGYPAQIIQHEADHCAGILI